MLPSRKARVVAEARRLGFDVVGVADATEPIEAEHDRYREFIARGMHGDMAFLEAGAGARRRLDTEDILPNARSIVCVGRRYARADEGEDPDIAKGVARYARGHDYHNFLRKKVRSLARFVRSLGADVEARPLCDVEPVMERVWAARAGLGFVGKHGLLITPGMGSYQLLGEVVTTLALEPDVPMQERCGSCTRCLDACPTSAFEAPFVLDPRKCISYLTIEAKGAPDAELEPKIGEHLFGCDECQEVCPFNKTAPVAGKSAAPFRPLEVFRALDVERLVRMEEREFDEVLAGSPLRRAGRAGMARNAAMVAASKAKKGDARAKALLVEARDHPDETVRKIARAATNGDNGGAGKERT